MNSQTAQSRQPVELKSIEEKIHYLRTLYIREQDITGPSTDLFFHELEYHPTRAERFRDLLAGIFYFSTWTLLRPLLYILLKLSGGQQIYQTTVVNGYKGGIVTIKRYHTGASQTEAEPTRCPSSVHRFLFRFGFDKLPLSVHLIHGEMTLFGPEFVETSLALKWADQYTDFYKRYAVLPGYIPPQSYFKSKSVSDVLQSELKQISRNTGKRKK
jgi:hypothetical protein